MEEIYTDLGSLGRGTPLPRYLSRACWQQTKGASSINSRHLSVWDCASRTVWRLEWQIGAPLAHSKQKCSAPTSLLSNLDLLYAIVDASTGLCSRNIDGR